jgi:uncharacterized protein YkwD
MGYAQKNFLGGFSVKRKAAAFLLAVAAAINALTVSAFAQTAKPGSFSVSVSGSSPVLKWDAVKGAVKYYVYRREPQTGKYKRLATTKKLSYTDGAVKSTEPQKYYVRAVDGDGAKSARTPIKSSVAKVKGLKASDITSRSVTLSWDGAKNAQQYVIEYAVENGAYRALEPTSATACSVSGLNAGVSYKFRIRSRAVKNGVSYHGSRSSAVTVTALSSAVTIDDVYNDDLAKKVYELTNKERAGLGLPALKWDDDYAVSAKIRVVELQYSWSHDRPDGRSCFTAFDEAGINYLSAGENLAMGSPADYYTAQGVVTDWMNSPGHRANIVSKNFEVIGVACYDKDGTRYWVQHFGKNR